MTVKLIIFDLDGVLVETKKMHYETLNRALESYGRNISENDHITIYDGLSTRKKLDLLTKNTGLSPSSHDDIYIKKQELTLDYINNKLIVDDRLINMLRSLKQCGYYIYIASNAVYQTVKQSLVKLGLIDFVDYFLSNEDVVSPKPSPEIYLKCFIRCKVLPSETIIIEDSVIGREAAVNSGGYLLPVESPSDLSLEKIFKKIKEIESIPKKLPKWNGGTMNIVIPMSGMGSRFEKEGYKLPKPLIDVKGIPMIQKVVENLNCDARYIFIVRKDHYDKYNLQLFLNTIAPNCKIIITEKVTEGAACSVLLAKEYINNNDHLLLANSDQYVEWDSNEFMYYMTTKEADGGILTFKSDHPKWSYAKTDLDGNVTEVAEKRVISDNATVGIYFYKKGKDFVKYAESMIQKNIRVNNEFYVCPVYNEFILDGKKILTKQCKKMWSLGVPEDLEFFLQFFNQQ